MSLYDNELVKKTVLITKSHDEKWKSFSKVNRMSLSQYIRLQIDDLHMESYDTPRTAIQTVSAKTQAFIGALDHEPPVQETRNAGNGKKQARWIKRVRWYNNVF